MQQVVCVRRKKKITTKSAPPKTHDEIHSSPATATTSRRLATKHVPPTRPCSLASINHGFVETALVITKNDEWYAYTDRQTDRQTS